MANQYTLLKKADKAFEKSQFMKASRLYNQILKNKYSAESRFYEANGEIRMAVDFALLAGQLKKAMRLSRENDLEEIIKIHIEEGIKEKIDVNNRHMMKAQKYYKKTKKK